MTLDRGFESQMVELDTERRGKTCAPFFTRCSSGGRQANSDRLEATDYSISDQLRWAPHWSDRVVLSYKAGYLISGTHINAQ